MGKHALLLGSVLAALASSARADYDTSAVRSGFLAAEVPGLASDRDGRTFGDLLAVVDATVPVRVAPEAPAIPCMSAWFRIHESTLNCATAQDLTRLGDPLVPPSLSFQTPGSAPGQGQDHTGIGDLHDPPAPASITLLATGLASVGLTLQVVRRRRRDGAGARVAGRMRGPGEGDSRGSFLEQSLRVPDRGPGTSVPLNLRVTRAELAALERLRDACEYSDGSFDEATAAAGIRLILGDEVIAFLCSGVAPGDRRPVRLSVRDDARR